MFSFIPPERSEMKGDVAEVFHTLENLRLGIAAGKRQEFIEFFESFFGKEKLNQDALIPFIVNLFGKEKIANDPNAAAQSKYFNSDSEYRIYCAGWDTYKLLVNMKTSQMNQNNFFSERVTTEVLNPDEKTDFRYYEIDRIRRLVAPVITPPTEFFPPEEYINSFENEFGTKKVSSNFHDFTVAKNKKNNLLAYNAAWDAYQFWKSWEAQQSQVLDKKPTNSKGESYPAITLQLGPAKTKFYFTRPTHAFIVDDLQKNLFFEKLNEKCDEIIKLMADEKNQEESSNFTVALFDLKHLSSPQEIKGFLIKLFEIMLDKMHIVYEYSELDVLLENIKTYFKNNPSEKLTLNNAKTIVLMSYLFARQSLYYKDEGKLVLLAAGLDINNPDVSKKIMRAQRMFFSKMTGSTYISNSSDDSDDDTDKPSTPPPTARSHR